MAEKLMTDGSMALREKQYRVITIEATEKPQNAKLRVAAYARVSSASDDQLNSFAAQNRHYSLANAFIPPGHPQPPDALEPGCH